MAALSGERSCQNSRRAKKAGLLVGGLTRLGGASQDLPAARKPFRAGRQPWLPSNQVTRGKESAADSIESVVLLFTERGHPCLPACAARSLPSDRWRIRARRSGRQGVRDPRP